MSNIARAEMEPMRQRAIELLLAGKSVIEASAEIGVARATLYRWIKEDPFFQAAYNAWQEQIQETGRARMLMLVDKAAAAVEKAIESGDAKTAVAMLKSMQILAARPVGSTDPAYIRETAQLKEKIRKHENRRVETRIDSLDWR